MRLDVSAGRQAHPSLKAKEMLQTTIVKAMKHFPTSTKKLSIARWCLPSRLSRLVRDPLKTLLPRHEIKYRVAIPTDKFN